MNIDLKVQFNLNNCYISKGNETSEYYIRLVNKITLLNDIKYPIKITLTNHGTYILFNDNIFITLDYKIPEENDPISTLVVDPLNVRWGGEMPDLIHYHKYLQDNLK